MRRALLMWLLVALPLLVPGCGGTPPTPQGPTPPSNPVADIAITPTPSPTPTPGRGVAFPVLGVETRDIERTPIENGQRIPLRDGLSVEVIVVPFPPFSETDLHLFLLRGETAITNAEIIVTYDMEDMDHGALDRQIGREVEPGHYGMFLDLFMYGDWVADVTISHQDFDASLRLLLGVYPWRERELAPQG